MSQYGVTDDAMNGDFNLEDAEVTRGVLIYQESSMLQEMRTAQPVVEKRCQRFPSTQVPLTPSDPLYIMPRTTLICRGTDAISIGNLLVEAAEGMFPSDCDVAVDVNRMRISVTTPGGLCFKVKVFAKRDDPEATLIAFRKDSGDWFAFSAFYVAAAKQLMRCGIETDSSSFFPIRSDA